MIARFIHISLVFFLLHTLAGCGNRVAEKPWWRAIPEDSPLVILHHDQDFHQVLSDRKTSLLQELGSFQTSPLEDLTGRASQHLSIHAIALYPTGSHELQPLFFLEDNGSGLPSLVEPFQKEFAVNSYRFQRQKIHIVYLQNHTFYASQLHNLIVLSKNSKAVEEAILTYRDMRPGPDLNSDLFRRRGHYLVNTPKMENWVRQIGAPRYLPGITDQLAGTGPFIARAMSYSYADPLYDITLTGSIPVDPDASSELVNLLSAEPSQMDLDRYVSADAAFFTLYQHNPPDSPDFFTESKGSDSASSAASRLDSLLLNDTDRYRELAGSVAPFAAFVAFEASGFLSVGEHLFLRRLEETTLFNRLIRELEQEGYLEQNNDVYYANSLILGQLLGSPLNRVSDFYFMRSGNAVVLTSRPGLARRIDQDRRRRAVYYYDDDYISARNRHPEALSSWFYWKSDPLTNYLEPFLSPVNHARFLATLLDLGTMSLVRNRNELSFQLDTYFSQDRTDPVRELWVHDLSGGRLTGQPVLANIRGGSRDELILATDNGLVTGVATDGTGFMEAQTGNDKPIGSPIVYDWYGNNQIALLIAAGNRIYAWNARGIPLPGFPVNMPEQITAPLSVADVSRNGRPEMIVVTADRRIHVLDQRGQNISGWPQDLNVSVKHQPVFRDFDGKQAIWLAAGNGLFAFYPNGDRVEQYPLFGESDLGPLSFHGKHILAGASDGHLYAFGREPFFADTLVVGITESSIAETEETAEESSMHIRRVYVASSPLINAPITQILTISRGERQIRERMIGIQSQNGNLFLLNEAGQLRMTRNMGETAADYGNMMITDLNGNGKPDLVGISSSGRLYAWQIESGEPVPHIPTSSMRYPVIADILGNGERELVGQTRDGLRCWSFRRP